ncbi:hypothetical protein [Thalassobellus suaedae]|uniref:Uncharacterized protein n=1 Tax=Thalassobellus suaedae TaxID=3074124 RepID=A0ABY9Y179_9FLAO|nr:hypothetical protein RHP49_13270 [Flavobacteriaceae bacterium HL-DH10]
MARMGGWSILDYALNFSETPCDWLQLGYASYLSSYTLINTGIEASNLWLLVFRKRKQWRHGLSIQSVKKWRNLAQEQNEPKRLLTL